MHLLLPDNKRLDLARPVIVGVLNLTPDSFSDGGRFDPADPGRAVETAAAMVAAGADAIDVGGESTRPGAGRIDADEQARRVMPALERIAAELETLISIDTTRAAVAERALDAGAAIVNDVSAGRDDDRLLPLVADRGAAVILMHMRGEPATMQHHPNYEDPVGEVRDFLLERARVAESHGVDRRRIVIDPGIGFGKTTEHNLALLGGLDELVATGLPVMLGASRKRFLGQLAGVEAPEQRATATAATTAVGVMAGVSIFRVHDVAPNRQAADVTHAIASHQKR
jgi:dihydropteroate synthase